MKDGMKRMRRKYLKKKNNAAHSGKILERKIQRRENHNGLDEETGAQK